MIRLRRFTGSIRTLAAHRTRTILALSGVAVGVAAVVVSGAIGTGAETAMIQTVQRLGTNLVIIKPLPVKRVVFRPQIVGQATTLQLEDFEAINALPLVAVAAPGLEGAVRVKIGGVAMRTTLRGTSPEFPEVRRFEVAEGRFFDADDMRVARRIAVLGARVDQEIGGGASVVGREIRIRGVPYDVIGVLRAKGATAEGADEDNQVLVPLPTAARRAFNVTWLTTIYASVASPERMDDAVREIRQLLRSRHATGLTEIPDDFAIQNTARSRAMQQELTRMLAQYAAGVATIALLVGGIGILALMVLSVRERTAEIGLRMAVGAQPRDVLLQFLFEATLLALGGWGVGVVLAGAGAAVVASATRWPIGVPLEASVASIAMAIVIGVGFGVIPARSAARIPPVRALTRS